MRYFKKLILQLATLHRVFFFLKIKEKKTIFFIMSTLLHICVRYNNKHARTNTKLFLNIIQKEKKDLIRLTIYLTTVIIIILLK